MKKQHLLIFLILSQYFIQVHCVFIEHWNEIRPRHKIKPKMILLPKCSMLEYDEDIFTSEEFIFPLNPTEKENSKSYGLTDDNRHIVYLNIVNEKFIPSTIFGLKYLKELDIRNTCFSPCSHWEIPPEIQCLASSLTKLNIYNTTITHLPDEIGKLVHLKTLKLSNTALMSLPDSIGDLSSLTRLYLPSNNLKALPITIKNLRSLQEIILKNNPYLHSIQLLNGLPSLKILDARHCSIKFLPRNLPQLTDLYMTNNSLTKLSGMETLGYKTNSKKSWYFDKNYIKFISPRISQVKYLYTLNLNDNKLDYLPSDICNISTLRHVFIDNNFLPDNKLEKICINSNILFKSKPKHSIQ